MRELAEQSDVLIENYKFGDLARYGLGYDDCRSVNPRLIYCSVTGFGQTGPYRERPGYDFMIQGMGGMMSVTGEPDDAPGGGPQRVGVPIADIITGMYATIAICAALAHRDRHRRRAAPRPRAARLAGRDARQPGHELLRDRRAAQAHRQPAPEHRAVPDVRTADGDVILACGNDNLFRKFCDAAGCAELAGDPRFATQRQARGEPRRADAAAQRSVRASARPREWVELLEAAGVPNGPINNIAQVYRGAAGQGARHARRAGAPCGQAAAGREPDALLRNAGRVPQRAAARSASTPTKCCASSWARARPRSPLRAAKVI